MRSFDEFWPFYLREHQRPLTRALHYAGTGLSSALLVAALALGRPSLLWFVPLCGYGLAWCSHFFVEKNRPATFRHPLWSLRADYKMSLLALAGRLSPELQRALPQH